MSKEKGEIESLLARELLVVDELLRMGSTDKAFVKFNDILRIVEDDKGKIDIEKKVAVYTSFSYFLFNISEFKLFFEVNTRAQKYDLYRNEMEKLIFEAFIEPNISEFKSIYEANMEFLISKGYLYNKKGLPFDQLPFWLLPTGKINEYYIYDKKHKLILDCVQLFEYEKVELGDLENPSNYLLVENWNLYNILSGINSLNKNDNDIYILLEHIEKFYSCLQGARLTENILSNVVLFDSKDTFKKYFENNNKYLPRNIINLTDRSISVQSILNEIHLSRIGNCSRNRKDVILSICIPTYNRGKRAYDNVIQLLTSKYDDEIEVVVSNNGTKNETSIYYDKIREIDDARLVYYEFEENQGYAVNISKVSELASGKFILLLSDEDYVNHGVLDRILHRLNSQEDKLALLKTSTNMGTYINSEMRSAGSDAILSFMLTSNYMSGLIMNNRLLKQYNGIDYVKQNLDNRFIHWYPHMYWEIFLCQYGVAQSTSLTLVETGTPEKSESQKVDNEGNTPIIIYEFATVEDRILQHMDAVRVFRDLEMCQVNREFISVMYLHLCEKTLFLVDLAIRNFYLNSSDNILRLLDKAYESCIEKEFYLSNISSNVEHFTQDYAIITGIYESYRKQYL